MGFGNEVAKMRQYGATSARVALWSALVKFDHSRLCTATINMPTLVAPGPTRVVPARLQRFGSADDMRKEASLPAPDALQMAGTPAPTPLPSQRQVSHPHGLVPTLQAILIEHVIQGILDQSYSNLDVGHEVLSELLNRLQAKRLLSDDNIALFALQELYLNNCPISDKGLRQLLDKSEHGSVRNC